VKFHARCLREAYWNLHNRQFSLEVIKSKVLSFSRSEPFFVDKTNLSPIDCLCVKMNYLWCCYCLNVTIYVSKIAEH